LARNKKSKKKSAMTTPFYNPNFEYVKERLDAGVPIFEKQSKRKNNTIEKNCLNEYELEDIEKGLRLNSHIISPRFNSMQGRDK
jgi:hypothetical protein